ncbi:MAG: ATP synthase F1 subunit gamma [Bacteroidales bacterium]|jgi:F-type H+-transporting ATPase subunit gamma|nr:ATP synthase F1 subunit gamma [Bacteroidales bacterium]
MANLKAIRIRIASVKSTRQITSAMKMVAAAKLRKAQDRIVMLRPYADKLREILSGLAQSLAEIGDDCLYSRKSDPGEVLIVVITSNRGLCGAFNANVIREVKRLINEEYPDQYRKGNLSFIAIGKKGHDFLRKLENCDIEEYNHLYNRLGFESVTKLASAIMADFVSMRYHKVVLVYNQFLNAAVQKLTTEVFLPVEIREPEDDRPIISDYIYEPGQNEIVSELIPKSLKLHFYKALLDSVAAEHGARMTSMHLATDNATELIRDLTLQYNKARQASITNQILEVVSGAEALRNG